MKKKLKNSIAGLNGLRELMGVKLYGKEFHNLQQLMTKLASYFWSKAPLTLGKGLSTALIELDLLCNLNSSDIVFG